MVDIDIDRQTTLGAIADAVAAQTGAPGYVRADHDDAPNAYGALLGRNVFIRTVTYHYTGRLCAVFAGELVLMDAAWIADTGGSDARFARFLADGPAESAEIEPYPDGDPVIIGRGAIVDVCPWRHALPRIAQ